MLQNKLRKVRINCLIAIALFLASSSWAQSYFEDNKEVYSNYMLFSDTITSEDTIVFVNSMNYGNFPELREDTISYFKKTYFRWSFDTSGASITFNFAIDGRFQGTNRYYNFQMKQEKIFGTEVIIFLYEKRLYFFEIIEERTAPYNEGNMMVLVKI